MVAGRKEESVMSDAAAGSGRIGRKGTVILAQKAIGIISSQVGSPYYMPGSVLFAHDLILKTTIPL